MAKLQDIDIPYLEFAEAAAPGTPASGIVRIYAKADGKLYQKDDAGSETDLAATGGSAAFSGAKVYRAATQTIANNTSTAVVFAAEEYDTDTYHDNSTNNTRLTAPATDKYRLTGKVTFVANATGVRQVWWRLNGTTTIRGSTTTYIGHTTHSVEYPSTCDVSLSATDYVELMCYQDSGGNLDIGHASTVDLQSTASITRLGH